MQMMLLRVARWSPFPCDHSGAHLEPCLARAGPQQALAMVTIMTVFVVVVIAVITGRRVLAINLGSIYRFCPLYAIDMVI